MVSSSVLSSIKAMAFSKLFISSSLSSVKFGSISFSTYSDSAVLFPSILADPNVSKI